MKWKRSRPHILRIHKPSSQVAIIRQQGNSVFEKGERPKNKREATATSLMRERSLAFAAMKLPKVRDGNVSESNLKREYPRHARLRSDGFAS